MNYIYISASNNPQLLCTHSERATSSHRDGHHKEKLVQMSNPFQDTVPTSFIPHLALWEILLQMRPDHR